MHFPILLHLFHTPHSSNCMKFCLPLSWCAITITIHKSQVYHIWVATRRKKKQMVYIFFTCFFITKNPPCKVLGKVSFFRICDICSIMPYIIISQTSLCNVYLFVSSILQIRKCFSYPNLIYYILFPTAFCSPLVFLVKNTGFATLYTIPNIIFSLSILPQSNKVDFHT